MEEFNHVEAPKEKELLHITEIAKSHLLETAKWANFIAITGFILGGFMLVFSLFTGSFTGISNHFGNFVFLITIFYLAMSIFNLYLSWLLYQFANLAKSSVLKNDSLLLTEALQAQKTLYKLIGITMIVVFSLYLLTFISMGLFM